MSSIRRASASDIDGIVQLARHVWPVAYRSILSPEQMRYMLDWMYSPAQLKKEMDEEGVRFWVAVPEADVAPCGFAALGPTHDAGVMKLHKLYVLPKAQGGGWGRRLVEACLQEARLSGATRVRLAVNKHNQSAQGFYQRLGFKMIQSVCVDIGQGFVMDDFVLEISVDDTGSAHSWWNAISEPPFRHPMGLRPGNLPRYWARTPSWEALTRERQQVLDMHPERHLVVQPGAEKLVESWEKCRADHGVKAELVRDAASRCRSIGGQTEFDWLLLDGELRFQAGVVCFPSSWAPEEKAGKLLSAIHEPVPELNSSLGRSMALFFERLKVGQAWERSNWGMSRCAEMNQHPARRLPRLDSQVQAGELFLRVEHQLLWKFEGQVGLLFCIRVEHVGVQEILSRSDVVRRLRGLIETMPDDVARYKGIHDARGRILELLAGEGL